MQRIRLIIEYDGTRYHGWQRQARAATIQEAVESAIGRISGEHPSVIGAGRTDAGVHAAGQVAHFESSARLDPATWHRALNAVLPVDIKVIHVAAVPASFHARHSADRKLYRYRLLNRHAPSPLERLTSWHVTHPLDLRAMRRAAKALVRRDDFRAFEGTDASHKLDRNTVCRITRCTIRRQGDVVAVEIEGDRFLKHMVRNIVGTLVEVGLGRRTAADVKRILRSRDRRQAGVTAPARGLTLITVGYTRKRRRQTSGRAAARADGLEEPTVD